MKSYIRSMLLGHLDKLGELMSLYASHDSQYIPRSITWINGIENDIKKTRNPLTSFLSTERGKIIATLDGYREDGIAHVKIQRKAVWATVCIVLARVDDKLRDAIQIIDMEFNDMRPKLAQLVALAAHKGLLPPYTTTDKRIWLEKVWESLYCNGETNGTYEYIRASLDKADRLYLLEEIASHFFDVLQQ